MSPFELLEPRSLREAIALIHPDDQDTRPLAGGTALMLMMKAGVLKPRRLVSLRRIEPVYARIALEAGQLRIGALAPLALLEHSSVVLQVAPIISQAMPRLSNVRVRNVATAGGSLAHADPHMDLPPILCALGAHAVIAGRDGERTLPVEALVTGYYETALRSGELITEIVIPVRPRQRAAYLKCTTRSADDWPALGVAVALETSGSRISACAVVVAAATDRPTRAARAEAELLRGAADDTTLRRAAEAAAAEVHCQSDAQGSAAYKKELVRVYVRRALRVAAGSEPLAAAGVPGH